MRHALSAKAQAGELIVWDNAHLDEAKTKLLRERSRSRRSPMC